MKRIVQESASHFSIGDFNMDDRYDGTDIETTSQSAGATVGCVVIEKSHIPLQCEINDNIIIGGISKSG